MDMDENTLDAVLFIKSSEDILAEVVQICYTMCPYCDLEKIETVYDDNLKLFQGEYNGFGYFRGLLQNMGHGQLLGMSDEAIGGLVAGIARLSGDERDFGEIYREVSETENMMRKRFAEQHPKAAFGAEMGGGLTTGSLGGSKIAGAKWFQNAKEPESFFRSNAIPFLFLL